MARTKIVFFGNERLATGLSTDTPVLKALIKEGYEICAVVVAQKIASASRKARDLEIVETAKAHNIPVIAPIKLKEAKDEIAAFDAEIAVLVAYGKIVPQQIIDVFPRGIINIHPSLLPLHRGPTPIESAILENNDKTGVSIMQLTYEMDAGGTYAQEIVELTGKETKRQLADRLIDIGRDLLIKHLPAIIDRSADITDQDDTKAHYDHLIDKANGILDFNKTAVILEREVRAYAGWPRSRCNVGLTEVIITKAHVVKEAHGVIGTLWLSGQNIGIHCKEGVLVFDRVIPTGRKEMDASAFLTGYQV